MKKYMRFFKSNAVRAVLVFFAVFMIIPFFFTEPAKPTPEDYTEDPVIVSKNPLAKIFDRISGFYLGKNKNAVKRNAVDVNGVAGDVYASKGALSTRGEGSGAAGEASGGGDSYQTASARGSAVYKDAAGRYRDQEQVQEYVRMDGKTYEVVTDAQGRKFVAMENGFVSFDKLMASTISKEEFASAKKLAPHFTDAEIAQAIHYPNGGIAGYLKSNDYYMYSHGQSPGMWGGPQGPGSGGGLDGLFGPGGAGLSAGANPGLVHGGGSSGSLGAKYAQTRGALAGAKGGGTYNGGKGGNDVTGGSVQGISVDNFKQVIGNNTGGDFKIESKDEKGKALTFTNSTYTQTQMVTLLYDTNNDNNIIPINIETHDIMTKEFLNGKENLVRIDNDQKNAIDKKCPSVPCWVFPNKIEKKDSPSWIFAEANNPILSLTEDYIDLMKYIDTKYVETRDNIIAPMLKKIPNFTVYALDGFDPSGKLKTVPRNTYYDAFFSNYFGVDSVANDQVDLKNVKKDITLLIVPNEGVAEELEKKGYKVVLFDKYAMTPTNTNKLFTDSPEIIRLMEEDAKRPKNMPAQAFIEDVKGTNINTKNIKLLPKNRPNGPV